MGLLDDLANSASQRSEDAAAARRTSLRGGRADLYDTLPATKQAILEFWEHDWSGLTTAPGRGGPEIYNRDKAWAQASIYPYSQYPTLWVNRAGELVGIDGSPFTIMAARAHVPYDNVDALVVATLTNYLRLHRGDWPGFPPPTATEIGGLAADHRFQRPALRQMGGTDLERFLSGDDVVLLTHSLRLGASGADAAATLLALGVTPATARWIEYGRFSKRERSEPAWLLEVISDNSGADYPDADAFHYLATDGSLFVDSRKSGTSASHLEMRQLLQVRALVSKTSQRS